MKLISQKEYDKQIKDWIKENNKTEKDQSFTDSIALDKIFKYNEFIDKSLNLGMFIACGKEGNVLEEPKAYKNYLSYNSNVLKENHPEVYKECEQYQEAKERVLFEGFDIEYSEHKTIIYFHFKSFNSIQYHIKEKKFYSYENIEDFVKMDLTLTPNAIKNFKH